MNRPSRCSLLHEEFTFGEHPRKLTIRIAWFQQHPMFKTLFLNNDAVFQDDNAPIHTARTVQSWFEEDEGELQQSQVLNITEPLWSVLENGVRKRFPPPISLSNFKMFFKKNGIKFH
jgi:hypothetical protein